MMSINFNRGPPGTGKPTTAGGEAHTEIGWRGERSFRYVNFPKNMLKFTDQCQHVFMQIKKNPNGIFNILDEKQVLGLTRMCERVVIKAGEPYIREGDVGTFFGIILSGKMRIDRQLVASDDDGPRFTLLGVGEVVGDMELCMMVDGTSNLRQTTVHANDEVLIAQFEFDSFTGYVEGLGSKMARRFSKRLADSVLVRVIYNETKSALEDRRLLQNISKERRNAVSWPCEEDLESNAEVVMPVSSLGGMRAERDEQDMSLKSFLRQGAGFAGSRGGGSLLSRIPSAESTVSDRGRISSTERSSGQSSPTLSTVGDRDVSPIKGIDYNGSQGEFRGSLLGLNDRMSSFERVGSDSSSSFKKAPMGMGIQLNKNMYALKRDMLAQVFDNLKILRELEEPLKEEVMEMFTSHRYSAGKCVIEKGELFSSYFAILDGSVGLFVKEDDENQDDSAKTDYSSSGRYVHRNETDSDDSSKGGLFQPHKFSSGGNNGDLFKGILKKSESAGGGVMDQSMADVHSLAKRNMKKLSKVVKNMTLLQTLKAKATLGEICLVAPMPSKHTVRAMEDTTILQLNAFDFNRAKQRFFRNMFEERVKLLQHAPFAALLTADMMANLADACVTCRYENGDNITCEANENSSQKFFMVMDGQAALLKPVKGEAETSEFQGDWSRVRMVETFLPNSCFGQDALEDPTIDMDIEKVRLSPTIVAVKHCTCISIDRGTFRNLVGSYEAIMAEIQGEKQKKKSVAAVAAFSGVASAAMLFRGVSLRRMSRRKSSCASSVEQATPSAASSAGAGLLAAIKRKVSSVEEETAQEAQKTVPEPVPAGGVGGAGDSGGGGGSFVDDKAKWRQWPSVVSWTSSTHLIRVYSGEEDAGTEAGPASTDDGQILAGRADKGKGDGDGAFGNGDKGKAAPGTFINMPSVVTWAQQKRDWANAAEEASEGGGPADVGGLVVGDGDGDGDGGQGGGEGIEQGRVSPSSLMKGLEQVHKQQQVLEGRRYSSSGAALRIGSSGSRAKTPGGGVALDPEGADQIPSHFSPAVTPLQSRQGSRSRMMSRGSGGSGDRSMSRGGKVGAMIQGEFSPKNIKRTVMEVEGSDEEGFAFAASASDEPESEEGEFGDDSDGDEDEAGLNLAHGRKQHLGEEGKNVKLPHLKDATPSKMPSKERGLMGGRSGSRTGTGSKSPGAEGLGDARSSRSSRGKSDLDLEMERAANIPGPSDYDIPRKKIMGGRLSPNGRDQDRSDSQTDNRAGPGPGQYPLSFEMPRGGRFLAGKRSKTALEMELYNKSRIPGPGMYEPGTGSPLKGGRISKSGRWVEGETALRRSANQPGPADYVSEYNGIEANARRTTARVFAVEHRSQSVELMESRAEKLAGKEARRRKRAKSRSSNLDGSKQDAGPSFRELKSAKEHIARLWGDREGSPPKELPVQQELSWEIRNMEAIRRMYKEQGLEV